ncbi:TetR/AcrR family transcriptional regulator [Paenibacillus sp. SC116]|uniref:TetR/AcrR family transcriptional regulator n=1 Tax=Paenibacillus sp. SC116 TaxID=2968986 RepID=UPI00215A11C4|nr:TetR/AcrR family transcriptional regulator [Paenibacillus sp. SC116]MCR8842661.1 TetR/AcrR family transcriptional regulator [Paenibacillus sp. SC116]
MINKSDLLAAALRIIYKEGINKFTLDAVALEAGVSKGGLIHHFKNKEELIRALNEQSLMRFKEQLLEEYERTNSYTQSYATATFKQWDDPDPINAELSMLAALANKKDLLHLWESEYQTLRQKMIEELVSTENGLAIRLICDGLIFSKMFHIDPLTHAEQDSVLQYIERLVRDNSV